MIVAKDKEHLKKLIKKEIELHGNKCSLNHIDVSRIKDLSYVLSSSIYGLGVAFEGDISEWDVSSVEEMRSTFYNSIFDKYLSSWKPNCLKVADGIFNGCPVQVPHWVNYPNTEDRKYAINAHQLENSIENSLSDKNTSNKKIKL